MLAHLSTRSWSPAREHRASCGERMRGPRASGPRARASASSAALRSTSRASPTLKRVGGRRSPCFLAFKTSLLRDRGAAQAPSRATPSRWLSGEASQLASQCS